MPQQTEVKVYTTEEAAKRLRMSTRTLLGGARSGRFPASKPAKRWLFTEEHIQQILDDARTAPVEPTGHDDEAPALTARQRRKAS